MQKVTIELQDYLYEFYKTVGKNAGGIKVELVISDAFFKLVRELSLTAIHKIESGKRS